MYVTILAYHSAYTLRILTAGQETGEGKRKGRVTRWNRKAHVPRERHIREVVYEET